MKEKLIITAIISAVIVGAASMALSAAEKTLKRVEEIKGSSVYDYWED